VRGATRGTDGIVGRRVACGNGFGGVVFAAPALKPLPLPLDMLRASLE
jgi:hypothetical protein